MSDPSVPLSVPMLVLQAKRAEIDAVRQLAGRAELVEVVGELIHALQRERGASSTYLASAGLRLDEVRRTAIDQARPVQARLRALFAVQMDPAQGASARMLSLMAWLLLGLDALDELRARIERQALTAHEAVAAFSRLIAGAVELISHVADAAPLPGVSRLLVALLHLVQGKEAAGQERAVGALLFASGTCSEAHRQIVLHLIDAQERNLQVFGQFADDALRARWNALQLSPGVAQLERLRRTLCTTPAGAALDSRRTDAWFEVCSDRIGELWELETRLVAQLRAACEAQIGRSEQDLQDSEGLLRRLRDDPPPHARAVACFFDTATPPAAVPDVASPDRSGLRAAGESTSVLELLQAQSARLASMEAELEAARRALDERKVIDRAKGVLMARLGLSEEAAFRALQKTSMDQNRRLVSVAEATLALPDFAFASLRESRAAPDGDKHRR